MKGDTPPGQVDHLPQEVTEVTEVTPTPSSMTNGHLSNGHLDHLPAHLGHLLRRKRHGRRPRLVWTPTMEANLNVLFRADTEGRFPCPVPNHTGYANLDEGAQGEGLVLRCCRGKERSLGEVWASICYARDLRRLSNKLILIWTRRLAWEIGGFEPVPVYVPAPQATPPYVEAVAQHFALLCGLRWKDWTEEPVAFSIKFVDAWSDLKSFHRARVAVDVLEEQGVIQRAGEIESEKAHIRPTPLYLPGPIQESGQIVGLPARGCDE